MPEIEIPLFVSPRNGELLGCGETNCGLWGQGVIFESDSSAARLALTMAGCEVCDRVSISSSDLGIVPVDTKKWGLVKSQQDVPEEAVAVLSERVRSLLERSTAESGYLEN